MLDKRLDALTQRVRKTLESDLVIAVAGWRDSNHSPFTRKLPEGKVIFLNSSPTDLPKKVGLVLFTRFMDHTVTCRIKKERPAWPVVIDVGQIKKILESCEDLMIVPPRVRSVTNTSKDVTATPAIPPDAIDTMDFDILDFHTEPTRRHEMDTMDHFTVAFLEAAKADKEGRISKIVLGKLLKKHGIAEQPAKLIHDGWIVGEASSSAVKIGWYKAGAKMLSSIRQDKFEPEDAGERAKFLIAQKPDLLAEKAGLENELERVTAELKAKIAQVEQKLERVGTAEKLLRALEAL